MGGWGSRTLQEDGGLGWAGLSDPQRVSLSGCLRVTDTISGVAESGSTAGRWFGKSGWGRGRAMALVAASAAALQNPSREWTPVLPTDEAGLQRRRAVRRRRKSRGSTQPRPLRPNEPIVFGYPRDRFTSHPSIASLRDESRRAESSIYGSRSFLEWTAEMEWARSHRAHSRLSLDKAAADARGELGKPASPPRRPLGPP